MSKESLYRFYEHLGQDEKMQQDYGEAIARGSLEAAAAFATAQGFDMTPDDLSEEVKSRSNELSEDELGKVSGGILPGSSAGIRSAAFAKFPAGDVLAGILDINRLRGK